MRQLGYAVILGSLALAGAMLALWLAGLFLDFGGLVHLLLVFAPLVAFAGATVGVVLVIVGNRQQP